MSMEIMKYKPYVKGALRGFFDVYIPKTGMEIFGCSLHAKGNQYWVNLPTREWQDESGETKYINVVRFRDKDHFSVFKKMVLQQILDYCKANQIDVNSPQEPRQPEPEAFEQHALPFMERS